MKAFFTLILVLISLNLAASDQENISTEKCQSKCVKINLDERYAPEWCCKVLMCNTYVYNKETDECELIQTKAEEYPVPCLEKEDDEI